VNFYRLLLAMNKDMHYGYSYPHTNTLNSNNRFKYNIELL